MKKSISVIVSLMLIFSFVPMVSATTPLASLVTVEELLYGQGQAGSLLQRIEKIEVDIYGVVQEGAVLVRIDRMQSFLQSAQGDGGLQLELNLAEWGFSATLTSDQPLVERLESLETVLYGEPQTGNIAKRSETIMFDIWGTTRLDMKKVTLPAQTLVRVSLAKTVDSGKAKVGDIINYRVVEDVMVDGRVVIPVGVNAQAKVTEVSSAGHLGKNGRVVVDFGRITSLDGTPILLKVDETATQQNKSLELAAGASMAGIVLLGPIGLVGGYFVKGKDVVIEANTQFYVETDRDMAVSGFYFRPALAL